MVGTTSNWEDELRGWLKPFLDRLGHKSRRRMCPLVRPAKAGVFSRDQTCRGKSQTPRSLDGRVEGNRDSEAHRQGLPWGDHESPGRNESEREVASKTNESGSRARKRRAKAAWGAEI